MAQNELLCNDKKCSLSSWKPHTHRRQNTFSNELNVFSSILDTSGYTPLVKLNKIPKEAGLKCDVYAKLEFFNPSGSLKDRIAFRMIEEAEQQGLLNADSTVIEPTSGNTGISLALGCAVKGYKCIFVMPEKISQDKESTMRILGAKIVRTPNGKAYDDPESAFQVAKRLNREIPNSIILDQLTNASNPLAHYDGTAEEILRQCGGKVDMICVGTGTGGTITGISAKVKEHCPNCEIIGVDPEGSQLALPESLNKTDVKSWEVEGIGYFKVFETLHRERVDRWIKIGDKMTMQMVRRLIREEGILSGESGGTTLAAALIAAQDLKEGQKCVVILADGIRNYMSKFMTDSWMEARGFKEAENEHNHWWWNRKVVDLHLSKPKAIRSSVNCKTALEFLNSSGLERVAVENDDGTLSGFISLKYLTKKVVSQNYQLGDSIEHVVFHKFNSVKKGTHLGLVARILETDDFVAVVDSENRLTGVIGQLQLLEFISNGLN